MTSDVIKRHM